MLLSIKRITTLGGIFFSLAAAAQSENKMDGWQGAKWGASRSEVEKAIPGVQSYILRTKDKEFHNFGFEDYDIDGCKYVVNLEFVSDALNNAHLSQRDSQAVHCPAKIRALLISKYGPQAISNQERNSVTVTIRETWFVDKTTIEMVDMQFPGIGNSVSWVDYKPRKTAGSGKL